MLGDKPPCTQNNCDERELTCPDVVTHLLVDDGAQAEVIKHICAQPWAMCQAMARLLRPLTARHILNHIYEGTRRRNHTPSFAVSAE